MGRKQLHKTAKQMLAQKQRYSDTRNAVRREEYANDAEYRKAVKERNLERYHDVAGTAARNARQNLSILKSFATKRRVRLPDGQTPILLCLDAAQMADALGGYHVVVFYRWCRTKRFPKPNLATMQDKGTSRHVYTLEQARALLRVMADHQKIRVTLRTDDTETIANLFRAMDEAAFI